MNHPGQIMSKAILMISLVSLFAVRLAAQAACMEKVPASGDMGPFTITGTNVVTQIAADGTVLQNNVSSPFSFSLTFPSPAAKASAAGISGQAYTDTFTVCHPAVPLTLSTEMSYNDTYHRYTEEASVSSGIMAEITTSHMSLAEGYILTFGCTWIPGCTFLTYQNDYTFALTYTIDTGAYTLAEYSTAVYSFLAPDGSTWYVQAIIHGWITTGSWPQIITPLACNVNLTEFTQVGQSYSDTTYDHEAPDVTIGDVGCSLSTLTMAINAANGNSFYDPGSLNDLFTNSSGGYTPYVTTGCPGSKSCGNLSFDQGARAASLGSLKFFGKNIDSLADPGAATKFLDQALCTNGRPVIVGVKGSSGKFPGHYVLVTGKRPDGSYAVVNPGSTLHTDTTSSAYSRFVIRGFVDDPSGDLSGLDLVISDVADILVTDPLGLQTGLLNVSTGAEVQNIAQSYHFSDALDRDIAIGSPSVGVAHTVGIFQPTQGMYHVAVTGLDLGIYTLQVSPVATDGTPNTAVYLTGIANTGSTGQFDIQFASAPSSSLSVTRVATFGTTQSDITNATVLGLIAPRGLSTALSQKLNAASAAAGRGQNETAVNILTALKSLVAAQTGVGLKSPLPDVLTEDADYLITQLH